MNTASKGSLWPASSLLPGLLAALVLWGALALPAHGQTEPATASERTPVSAAHSAPHAPGYPSDPPATHSFLSWRHIVAILTALVMVGLIVVLYVHGWNALMMKEVEKRTRKLKAELDERMRAEEALRANMEDSLRQSQKMESVGRLAGGVAHDFNNLLSGIMGFSEILLCRMPQGDRNREYVDDIILTAQRAADLTSKLLAFSHRGSIRSVSVDVHDIIREVIAILSETVDRRIQLHRNLTAPSPAVEGDPSQIQNAILNLALNARDAMPNGGVMTLSTGNVTLDAEFCRDNPFDITPGAYLEIGVTVAVAF